MSRPPWHILLIEDNPDDCADLRQMLLRGSSRRYRFSEARFGGEGVRMVLDPQTGPVDCVLLDYDLPDMNAHAVLAALRAETGMPPCPVVVITGMVTEEGRHLLGAGAQDYLGKRWASPESLTRAVDNAVERFAMQAERQRAQEALLHLEEHYRALFDSIDAGFAVLEMIFDAHGAVTDARYLLVNPAFAQQSGLANAQGRTVRELLPDLEPIWFETYGTVALTGEPVRMEQYSGSIQRWFGVHAFRMGAAPACQVGVLFNDITARKRAEQALIAAKAEAEAANRAKSDFLMSMSHELRSPLSAMLGFAQLIEAGTPPPSAIQRSSVEHILNAGWYLLGLINEILDLTSIESGKTVLLSQSMSLQALLDDCQAMVELQAEGAGIRLVFHRAEARCVVQADPTRTKQVLINLLSNAIKYNRSAGQVTVSCALTPEHRVRVSVEDTGPGLSAAQIAQLFQPFNRLGRESGAEPGTGIGLVICQRLVGLMGGSMGVDSTPGVGSCFWFELEAAPPPTDDRVVPRHTVLCIEDDAAAFLHFEANMARLTSASLLRARDLKAGIRMARSARPDVILIGVRASDPSGVQAMQLLARDPTTSNIPVIALCADAMPRDVEVGLAAGYFGFLTQPLQGDAVVDALQLAFQRSPGQRAAAMENTRC